MALVEDFEQRRYPAMPALPDPMLTPIATPAAARAALAAEAATSVADADERRRGWWLREPSFLVAAGLGMAVIAVGVYLLARPDKLVRLWTVLPAGALLIKLLKLWAQAVTRAVPRGNDRWLGSRLRMHTAPRAVPAPPRPASWPPGAEAYAVLSAAAAVATVNPAWLAERLGLPTAIGAQWVSTLRRYDWLAGGGHILGLARLPELHVHLTPTGHARLEQERARLTALAATPPSPAGSTQNAP